MLLAPALIASGINILAAHWFIVFTSLFACITPPVAVVAFATAELAQADPMKTALMACRMGIALFLLPIFCVLAPELLLIGNPVDIVRIVAVTTIGIVILNGGIEGYLFMMVKGAPLRIMLAASGVLMCLPYYQTELIGGAVFLLAVIMLLIIRKATLGAESGSLSTTKLGS